MEENKYMIYTVFSEFRHEYSDNNFCSKFIDILNKYYDLIKNTNIDIIKSLLPINFHGYCGSYLEDWMISEIKPNKNYPFSIIGKIYNWYGDKSTCDIVTSVANTYDELYQRLLVQYMYYLHGYIEIPEALDEFNKIVNKLKEGTSRTSPKKENNIFKIWIARDVSRYISDDEKVQGDLTLFYDTPQLVYDSNLHTQIFSNARVLAKLPVYMFPNVKEGEYLIFEDCENLKEKYRDAALEVVDMALDGKFGYDSDMKYINEFDKLVK